MYGLFCFSTNLRPVRGLALVSVHILLRLLQPIKQNFLSEINRTLPKILFSWATSCVSPAYQSNFVITRSLGQGCKLTLQTCVIEIFLNIKPQRDIKTHSFHFSHKKTRPGPRLIHINCLRMVAMLLVLRV